MPGDGVVLILVCASLLVGVVIGLRFNVRLLAMLCLAAIGGGLTASIAGVIGVGQGVLMSSVAVVALQVGYFVAMLIGAMRLGDEPVELAPQPAPRESRRSQVRPRRA